MRVGSTQPITVDFRCVAATNKNLEQLIRGRQIPSHLFYRLNVFHIELPSLRERRDDTAGQYFVAQVSLAMSKKINRVNPAAMDLLQQQPWPGNIRELENAIERAMVVAQNRKSASRISSSNPRQQLPTALQSHSKRWKRPTSCACSSLAAGTRPAPPRRSISIASLCIIS